MFLIEIKGLSNINKVLFFNFLNKNKYKLQCELIDTKTHNIIFKCNTIINNFIKYINDLCINLKINDTLEFNVKYCDEDNELSSIRSKSVESLASLNSYDTIDDMFNIEDFF